MESITLKITFNALVVWLCDLQSRLKAYLALHLARRAPIHHIGIRCHWNLPVQTAPVLLHVLCTTIEPLCQLPRPQTRRYCRCIWCSPALLMFPFHCYTVACIQLLSVPSPYQSCILRGRLLRLLACRLELRCLNASQSVLVFVGCSFDHRNKKILCNLAENVVDIVHNLADRQF